MGGLGSVLNFGDICILRRLRTAAIGSVKKESDCHDNKMSLLWTWAQPLSYSRIHVKISQMAWAPSSIVQ